MTAFSDTETMPVPQGVSWNEEDWQSLLSRLPAGWQEQALEQGAWTRKRKLSGVSSLLRALLTYAVCGYSFQQLGIWATVVGLGNLCERAWRKRAQRAQAWISWLLGALLGSGQTPAWLPQTGGRILLVDGSRLKTCAGTGEDLRLHTTYHLGKGCLQEVRITDRSGAEGLGQVSLQAGDVVVTDAGYALGKSVALTQKAGAFGIHRFSAHHTRLERADGQKLDLKGLVKHQGYNSIRQYQAWVWDSHHQQRFPLRLIISLPPRKQVMLARARKRDRLRAKKGSKASLAPAWWAGVWLLGTTLPASQCSATEVVQLYRARWQIELFFKRLKGGLHLHWVPFKQWSRAQAYVELCLIAWALQEQEMAAWKQALMQVLQEPEVGAEQPCAKEAEAQPWVVSHWQLARWGVQDLQMLLRGTWTHRRERECLPLLRRYWLRPDRRKRPSQEREMSLWCSHRLALPSQEVSLA